MIPIDEFERAVEKVSKVPKSEAMELIVKEAVRLRGLEREMLEKISSAMEYLPPDLPYAVNWLIVRRNELSNLYHRNLQILTDLLQPYEPLGLSDAVDETLQKVEELVKDHIQSVKADQRMEKALSHIIDWYDGDGEIEYKDKSEVVELIVSDLISDRGELLDLRKVVQSISDLIPNGYENATS